MPSRPLCKFWQAVDTRSKKLLVRLEIWSGREVPGADCSSSDHMPSYDAACSISKSLKTLSTHARNNPCSSVTDFSLRNTSSPRPRSDGRRARSDVGRQKQYERWQRRKQEK